MKLSVVDGEKRAIEGPWLLRIPGWTRERFLAEAPEMRFCEFERGELVMPSPVKARHQRHVRFLTVLLNDHCERTGAGEVFNGPAVLDVSEEVLREPDIFVVPAEGAPAGDELLITAVPSLVIEVISPSTRGLDLRVKAEEYRAKGVAEYWAVDYDRRELTAHWPVRVVSTGVLESVALPGFRITVDWLWQDPLPRAIDCVGK